MDYQRSNDDATLTDGHGARGRSQEECRAVLSRGGVQVGIERAAVDRVCQLGGVCTGRILGVRGDLVGCIDRRALQTSTEAARAASRNHKVRHLLAGDIRGDEGHDDGLYKRHRVIHTGRVLAVGNA